MLTARTWSNRQARARFVLSFVLITAVSASTAWGVDPMAEKELGLGRDPSFESVSSHYPGPAGPSEAISVKDHRDEFAIRADGGITWHPFSVRENQEALQKVYGKKNGKPVRLAQYMITGTAFFAVGKDEAALGGGYRGTSAKKSLLDGYMPVMITDFTHSDPGQPDLKYEQTALAWSKGLGPDEPLWLFARLKVANPGKQARTVRISWGVDFRAPGVKKIHTVVSRELKLAPGAKGAVYGKLPYVDGHEKAAECSAEQFDSRLAEVSAFWKELLNKGMRINVPEQRVNDAYRAWLAYTFFNVDKQGPDRKAFSNLLIPHDGHAWFYDGYFGLAAIKYCDALARVGCLDEARAYLNDLTKLIMPSGQFIGKFGLIDPGTLLLVIANHYELTGDEQWFRKVAPKMVKMCDYLFGLRNSAMAKQEKDSPYYGLIKTKIGVDNSGHGSMYTFHGDMGICVGLEAMARSLGDLEGMEEETARIKKESSAYRKDVEKAMRTCVFEHNGLRVLPLTPERHMYIQIPPFTGYARKDHVGKPDEQCSGHGYYSLFASMLLETQFMPAADKDFVLLAELLERRDGLFMGMCTFGVKGGIDHGFTYGYWINCLERDEVERVLLGFYGSMAYSMSRGTWSGTETANVIKGSTSVGPHLRSGTQQLRLLRNMLVREDGNRLILAQAAPQHWMADGKRMEVLDAPTHFGSVSYTIDSHADQGRIAVKIDPPTRKPPEAIVLHLRHPKRAKIKGVTVDGKPVEQFGDGAITLEGLVRPARIEVHYR